MPEASKPRYQILVVDDEPTVRRAMQLMLKHHGHTVQTASDGQEALTLFGQGTFDLVITDYLMPEMTGDQLVARLRGSRPDQRIIMITAFADDLISEGEINLCVNLLLNKPVSLEELRRAIEQVMV